MEKFSFLWTTRIEVLRRKGKCQGCKETAKAPILQYVGPFCERNNNI
jgi:hypothetical protein